MTKAATDAQVDLWEQGAEMFLTREEIKALMLRVREEQQTSKDLRTLLYEVLVGMRNAPVRRAMELLARYGLNVKKTEETEYPTYAAMREAWREEQERMNEAYLALTKDLEIAPQVRIDEACRILHGQ